MQVLGWILAIALIGLAVWLVVSTAKDIVGLVKQRRSDKKALPQEFKDAEKGKDNING